MPYEKQSKQSGIFSCENCSFNTDKRQNYISHLDTRKHKILLNPSNHPTEKESFSCVCGKEYKHRQTLYAHKKNVLNYVKIIRVTNQFQNMNQQRK